MADRTIRRLCGGERTASMKSNSSSYLQTAGRALSILKLFETNAHLSLSEIAELTGLPNAIVYRLLYTLTSEGFLHQNAVNKMYCVGDETISLGLSGLRQRPIFSAAHGPMWEYYRQNGQMLMLTVCINWRSVVIDHASSLSDEEDMLYLGYSYPLERGASNRTLLAFMDKEAQEQYLSSLLLEPPQLDALRAELDRIREQGYDYTEQMFTKGLWALGMPVFDRDGSLAGCISMSDYIDSTPQENFDRQLFMLSNLVAKVNRTMLKSRLMR